MQRYNSYHLIIFFLSISLYLSIFQIYQASASDETSSYDQVEKTQQINEKEPTTPVPAKEAGDESLATKDIPLAGGDQIKIDNNQRIENNKPTEEIKGAQDQGNISNNEPLPQNQAKVINPEIPIEMNKHVVDHITYFQTGIRDKFKLWLSRSSKYIPIMRQILKEFELPEDLVYLSLIESGFNPNAYSRAKAVGPWQFIKSTGRKYGLRIDDWVDERRDPVKSTVAAARYLKDLFNMFGSWNLALASYNAGEGKIQRALVKSKRDDFWDLTSTRHIKRETKEYVPKFMAATIIAKNPERYGFDVEYSSPMLFDEVTVDSTTSLSVVAKASETTLEEIRELNPDLKRDITPPEKRDYVVHIPYGKKEIFYKNYNAIPREERINAQKYRVKRGETLPTIARRYGIAIDLLRELNGFNKNKALKDGEYIVVASFPAIPKKKIEYASVEKVNNAVKGKNENTDLVIYKVRKGDTLWDISKRFNIPVDQIKKWNGIGRRNIIKPGEKLTLNPDGATG